MKVLTALLENESVQQLLTEDEELIVAASGAFEATPEVVKDYIKENLEEFLVPGDVKATYENMVEFTAEFAKTFLEDLVLQINGEVSLEE